MSTKKLQILGSFIDETLTQSGQAADAKVAGEKISDIETRIDNIGGLVGDESVATQIDAAINDNVKQPDWEQTDETAMDFIKNKPYEETADDALEMLNEMGVIEATTNEEGFVLTDENGNILTV